MGTFLRVLLGYVTLAVFLVGCGNDGRRLELRDSQREPRVLSEEQRRLQSLQLVRYVDGDGNEGFMPVAGLAANDGPLLDYCNILNICPGMTSNEACFHAACTARVSLCTARMLQSAAMVRAEGLRLPFALKWLGGASQDVEELANYETFLEEVTLPPQSPGARVAILREAVRRTSEALKSLTSFSGGCPNTSSLPEWDSTAARELPWSEDTFAGGLYAEVTVQAYDLLNELSEDTVDAILAAADSQRSLSTTTAQAAARSFAGEQLSRAEAAHLLIGGSPGLLGQTTKAFCNSPELSGRARAALGVIRRAAPNPADIVSSSTSLDALLEGPFPGGSIRERLEILDGRPISSLLEHTGFAFEDYAQARSYLAQEIELFARDGSVTVIPDALQPIPPGMLFYGATATEPTPPPPEYFAALARRWTDAGPLWVPFGDLQATDLSANLAVAMGRIRNAVGLGAELPYILGLSSPVVEAQEQFQAPLNLLAARDERVAQLGWRRVVGGVTRFYVDGHNAGDKLRIVRGLSGLLCATTGRLEGAPCTSTTFAQHTVAELGLTATIAGAGANPQVVGRGYMEAAYGNDVVSLDWSDSTPLFLVKPKNPTYEVPGEFTSMAGFQLTGLAETDGSNSIHYRFAIFPELEKKAGEILRPSTKWCTRAAVECDGTLFDERMPLENELSDDQDGVESSWRHYLAMAEQAAAETHALGEEYLLNGLEVDRSLEAAQLREAADRQRYLSRVEGEMETLQGICGTAMDTSDILGLVGGDGVGPTNGLACSQASDCCGNVVGLTGPCPYSCNSGKCVANSCLDGQDSACPSPYKCIKQRCTYSPVLRIIDAPNPSEGLSRMRECIGQGTVHPYVALGSVPLCLWDEGPANPTNICEGATIQYPCPVAARKLPEGGFDCEDRILPGKTGKLVKERLNLVDSSVLLDPGEDPCDLIRRARNAEVSGLPVELPPGHLYLSEAIEPPMFGPEYREYADKIGWRVEKPSLGGNVASILLDKKVLWTTRPGADAWPCAPFAPAGVPDVWRHGPAFFSDGRIDNCSQENEGNKNLANEVNQRMYSAVLHLKGLWSGDFDKIEVPAYASDLAAYGAPRSTDDSGAYFTQKFDGGVVNYFDDPAQAGGAPFWRIYGTTWDGMALGWSTQLFDVPAPGSPLSLIRTPLPRVYWSDDFVMDKLLPSLFRAHDASSIAEWTERLNATRPFPHGSPNAVGAQLDEPYLMPHVKYSSVGIYDAAEILCELTRRKVWYREPFVCPQVDLETLAAGGDLDALKEYSSCRVELFNRAVGSLVLARVPKRVVDGLRTFAVTGASPIVGGRMGSAMDRLRAALTRYADFSRTMADLARDAHESIDRMNEAIKIAQVQSAIDENVEAQSMGALEIAKLRTAQQEIKLEQLEFRGVVVKIKAAVDCAGAIANGVANTLASLGTSHAAAAAQCAMAAGQMAADLKDLSYEKRIARREGDIARWQEHLESLGLENASLNAVKNQAEAARTVITELAHLRGAVSGIDGLNTEAQASLEEIRASVTDIESLRLEAQRAIMRAMQFETTQAAATENIEAVLAARLNTSKRRYLQAHKNAVRYAFLAKRAIEQRLGMHLSELRADMPLVDAPASWEADICAADGIDYNRVRAVAAQSGKATRVAPVDYSKMYIGDYVTKLQNVVESYRLEYDFHEGTDEAIASIRDDILKVRAPCVRPATNQLYFSSQLDALVPEGAGRGWEIQGCEVEEGIGISDECFSIEEAEASELPVGAGFMLSLGTEATAATSLVQRVRLGPGLHRISWFTHPDVDLQSEVKLQRSDGLPLDPVVHDGASKWVSPSQPPGEWPRQYRLYVLDAEQEVLVMLRPLGSAVDYTAGGVMLEVLPDSEIVGHPLLQIPGPYVATSDSLELLSPFCEDKGGEVFRRSSWKYRCTKLCTDGFSDNCLDSSLADRCYWETTFSLDLRDLESGRIFEQSGFARGNFNYRIEDIGVNFVGTELRDCSQSPLPSTCNAAGFVTYSLQHLGPLFVRNHTGGDFPVKLFDGKIEHARGLGLERYLTNPLSNTDRELLTPYVRKELTGRPLDGNFVLRVWDENGVNFSAIEDVQLYLKYRYWTRFN